MYVHGTFGDVMIIKMFVNGDFFVSIFVNVFWCIMFFFC